jgi:two-component sensor histidine kinase
LIPLGLIINELLTNACKYAFPLPEGKTAAADGQGIVQVKLQHLDEGTVLLRVKDNGAGVESGVSPLGKAGLGLALVQSIGEGLLGGTISYEMSQGFGVSIEFPINSYETRV